MDWHGFGMKTTAQEHIHILTESGMDGLDAGTEVEMWLTSAFIRWEKLLSHILLLTQTDVDDHARIYARSTVFTYSSLPRPELVPRVSSLPP